MSKSLWGVYDGEPFMENPHLIVLNPRKKGKKNMARKSSRAHMAYVRSFRKGTKKRNPVARVKRTRAKKGLTYMKRTAKRRYTYGYNPKRRRRTMRARRNPWPIAGVLANKRRRRSHRGYKRNPSIMGFNFSLPPIKQMAYGAAGFMGTPMLESFVNKYLPASITASPIGRYAVKIGCVIGLSYLAKTVLGREEAKTVAMGGGTYVVVSAINEFVVPQITSIGSYGRSTPLGSYSRSNGLGAYGSSRQLSAGSQTATGGGSSVTANRFRRYS